MGPSRLNETASTSFFSSASVPRDLGVTHNQPLKLRTSDLEAFGEVGKAFIDPSVVTSSAGKSIIRIMQ